LGIGGFFGGSPFAALPFAQALSLSGSDCHWFFCYVIYVVINLQLKAKLRENGSGTNSCTNTQFLFNVCG